MQGIPAGFRAETIFNYLIQKGLSASAVGSFVLIVALPWSFQFIWGPIVDRFQNSLIGHRKLWVVLTQLIAASASLGLLYVHDPISQLGVMSALFFTHSLFASIQDTSVDAMAIDVTPIHERGSLNALMRIGFLVGTSVGSAGLAPILQNYGFQKAALVQSVLLLIFTGVTFFIRLNRTDPRLPSMTLLFQKRHHLVNINLVTKENPRLSWVFKKLFRNILEKNNLRIFICIWAVYLSSTIFYNGFIFSLIHNLKWQAKDVSVLEGSWVNILVVGVLVLGGLISDRFGALKIQRWVFFLAFIFLAGISLSFPFWHKTSIAITAILVINLIDPFMSVAAMPLLMNLCDYRIAGSQFTTYMALINFGDVLGAKLSGWAQEVFSVPIIGLGCAGFVLLALLGLRNIKARQAGTEALSMHYTSLR